MSLSLRVAISLATLLGSCGAAPAPAPEARSRIEALSWLVGQWETDGANPTGERWSRDGGRLVGEGFTARSTDCGGEHDEVCNRLEELTEELEIVERDGTLLYVATPVSQARTEFQITEASPSHLVAESPAHDFPTRIEYRLLEGPRRIEAHVSNAERGFDLILLAR